MSKQVNIVCTRWCNTHYNKYRSCVSLP